MENYIASSIDALLNSYKGITVDRYAETRWVVTFVEPWRTGDFKVELSIGFLSKDQIKIYEKNKWVEKGKYREDQPVIWIQTYATDETGCHGYFNPQSISELVEDPFHPKKQVWRSSLDFDWLLEANCENCIRILKEIEQNAYNQDTAASESENSEKQFHMKFYQNGDFHHCEYFETLEEVNTRYRAELDRFMTEKGYWNHQQVPVSLRPTVWIGNLRLDEY